jgi:leukotriene-A4 hydrolase
MPYNHIFAVILLFYLPMPTYKRIIYYVVILLACACSNSKNLKKPADMSAKDVHSFARPEEAAVTHIHLNLNVDFNRHILEGFARINFKNITGTDSLFLDTRDLNIEKVTIGKEEKQGKFSLGEEVKFLGKPLSISIGKDDSEVTVYYKTSPDAAALMWLNPEQTAGKQFPFLFSQSQAILARTWVPCQDGPGVKFTYSADIQCPNNLMALMSAENDTLLHKDGKYHFNMPQPVSSYLMALAVGDIRFHPLGKNTGVYTEPVMLERCVYEFEDMQKMVDAASALYGEYAWGRYDVIVLPPSFPFGGMENPRLTFATPTIIAGDRSLVALVAHELAHSWSGNLVTNATWNDFWLNEGFTMYFENRIMEKLYGRDYAEMLDELGFNELQETVKELGDSSPDTHLFLNLVNRDPDDGMNDIAYIKGQFFLKTVESVVGREKMDAFLNAYFKENAFHSMTTEKFVKYFNDNLIKGDSTIASKIQLDKWIYGPGIPSNSFRVHSVRLEKAANEAKAFAAGKAPKELNTKDWSTHEWLQFLRSLPQKLTQEQCASLDKKFHFTQSGNCEILCDWFQHTIESNYIPAEAELENFLMNVGRRKFILPLYKALVKTESGRAFAKQVYAHARPGYHSVAQQTIDELLKTGATGAH